MHTLVSVKKPLRAGGSLYPASGAGSIGPKKLLGPVTRPPPGHVGRPRPYRRPGPSRWVGTRDRLPRPAAHIPRRTPAVPLRTVGVRPGRRTYRPWSPG